MFRVTFLTKDDKLGVALKALLGVAVGKPDYEPVHDVAIKNGQAVSAPLTIHDLAKRLPAKFKTADVKALLASLHQPSSGTLVNKRMKEMVSARLIRKGRQHGHYERVK